MAAYYEDQLAERRARWAAAEAAVEQQTAAGTPAAGEISAAAVPDETAPSGPAAAAEPAVQEPFPAADPRLTDSWTYVDVEIGIIPLPVTRLVVDDKPRCDDCGYLTIRCACRIEYRGGLA